NSNRGRALRRWLGAPPRLPFGLLPCRLSHFCRQEVNIGNSNLARRGPDSISTNNSLTRSQKMRSSFFPVQTFQHFAQHVTDLEDGSFNFSLAPERTRDFPEDPCDRGRIQVVSCCGWVPQALFPIQGVRQYFGGGDRRA